MEPFPTLHYAPIFVEQISLAAAVGGAAWRGVAAFARKPPAATSPLFNQEEIDAAYRGRLLFCATPRESSPGSMANFRQKGAPIGKKRGAELKKSHNTFTTKFSQLHTKLLPSENIPVKRMSHNVICRDERSSFR